MILDSVDRLPLYAALLPGAGRVLGFLGRRDLGDLPDGRVEIDGGRLYASIESYAPRDADLSRFEAHRRHIDVQILVGGDGGDGAFELCGVAPARELSAVTPYDEAGDIFFGRAAEASWIRVTRRRFAIFLPGDAHLPGRRPAGLVLPPVRKCVVKIPV